MPCMSYDTNWASSSNDREVRKLKQECDKLARIACKAMTELVKSGYGDFLVLKDDEVREWWEKHQEDDRKAQEARLEKERRAQVKKEALAKLSDDEKQVLGIPVPKKNSSKSVTKKVTTNNSRVAWPLDNVWEE